MVPLTCFADGKPLQQVTAGLQIGSLQTDARNFLLLKAYRLDLLDCPLDGVLGWDFLADYALLIDFHTHQLTLWQGGNLTEEERRSVHMQDAVALPRANKTPGSFDIQVRLSNARGQRDVTLAVDTGGARTLIAPQDARALDLEPTCIALPQRSIFGSLKVNEATLQTLEVGGLRLSDLSVRYLTQDHPNMPPHLGLDVLSRYRLLIDYPAKMLYLKYRWLGNWVVGSIRLNAPHFQLALITQYLTPTFSPPLHSCRHAEIRSDVAESGQIVIVNVAVFGEGEGQQVVTIQDALIAEGGGRLPAVGKAVACSDNARVTVHLQRKAVPVIGAVFQRHKRLQRARLRIRNPVGISQQHAAQIGINKDVPSQTVTPIHARAHIHIAAAQQQIGIAGWEFDTAARGQRRTSGLPDKRALECDAGFAQPERIALIDERLPVRVRRKKRTLVFAERFASGRVVVTVARQSEQFVVAAQNAIQNAAVAPLQGNENR